MAFSALYDACVVIPHEIRDILMISAGTRLHAVYWSEDIFAEWIHAAVTKNLSTKGNVLRFQTIMNQMYPGAMIARHRYDSLIASMANDEKDRHVLAAAVVADVDVLVTNNVDDFPKESVAPYNIEVQKPDEFVRTQAGLNPLRFREAFLTRARSRNQLSIDGGHGPLLPEEIAQFLRDGPSLMPMTGQYILDLLSS